MDVGQQHVLGCDTTRQGWGDLLGLASHADEEHRFASGCHIHGCMEEQGRLAAAMRKFRPSSANAIGARLRGGGYRVFCELLGGLQLPSTAMLEQQNTSGVF